MEKFTICISNNIKLSICKLSKRAIKASLCQSLCHPLLLNIF